MGPWTEVILVLTAWGHSPAISGMWEMKLYTDTLPMRQAFPFVCPEKEGWCVGLWHQGSLYRIWFSRDALIGSLERLPDTFSLRPYPHLRRPSCFVDGVVPGNSRVGGKVCDPPWWGWLEIQPFVEGAERDTSWRYLLHAGRGNREIRVETLFVEQVPYAAQLIDVYKPGIWWGTTHIFRHRWIFYRVEDGAFYVLDVPSEIEYFTNWKVIWRGDLEEDGDLDWVLWGRSARAGSPLQGIVVIRNQEKDLDQQIAIKVQEMRRMPPWTLVRHTAQLETFYHYASFFHRRWLPELARLRRQALGWMSLETRIRMLLGRLLWMLLGAIGVLGLGGWAIWHYRNIASPQAEVLEWLLFYLRSLVHEGRAMQQDMDHPGYGRPGGHIREIPSVQSFHEHRNQILRVMRAALMTFFSAPFEWIRWYLFLWWTLRIEWMFAWGTGFSWWMVRVARNVETSRESLRKLLEKHHTTLKEMVQHLQPKDKTAVFRVKAEPPKVLDLRIYRPHAAHLEMFLSQALRNALEAKATKVELRFSLSESAEILEVAIVDNGSGLTEELVQMDVNSRTRRIFTSGFSSKGSQRGYGFTENDLFWIERTLRGSVSLLPVDIHQPSRGTLLILEIPLWSLGFWREISTQTSANFSTPNGISGEQES